MAIVAYSTRTLPNPVATYSDGFVFLLNEDWLSSGSAGDPFVGANAFANGGGDVKVFTDSTFVTQLPIHVVEFVTGATPKVQVWVRKPTWTAGDTITIGKDDTQTVQPAPSSTYGQYNAYQDKDRVYPLNGHTGIILEDYAGNDNGVLVGSVVSGSAIAPYGAASTDFNASGYYNAMVDPSIGSLELAVSFWWNGNDGASAGVVNSYNGNSDTSFLIFSAASTATMRFRISKAGAAVEAESTTSLYNDGLDHYVQCFYDGANIRIIVDGVIEGTTPRTGVIETPSTAPFNIGAWNNDISRVPTAKAQSIVISTSGNSLDKLADEHTNQSDPSNFGTGGAYTLVGTTQESNVNFSINKPVFAASIENINTGNQATINFFASKPVFFAAIENEQINNASSVSFTLNKPAFSAQVNNSSGTNLVSANFSVNKPIFNVEIDNDSATSISNVNFSASKPLFSSSILNTNPPNELSVNFTIEKPAFTVNIQNGDIVVKFNTETNYSQEYLSTNYDQPYLSTNYTQD